MADVFISYSRDDRPAAERLAAALDAQGISYWMDSHLAGGSTFTDVTEEELNKADKVIVLWSETSIKSGWVKDEAQAAREQGKLVPLTIDGSQPPMGFRQIQTVDVSAWARGKQEGLPAGVLHGLEHSAAASSEPGVPLPDSKPVASRRNVVLAAIAATAVVIGALVWAFAGSFGTGSKAEARVVVMPISAVGNDPDEAALASGITEELIVRLRRIPGLQVGSGLSGEKPEGNALYGSLRKVGDQLRVSARLEDAASNIVWSQSFDRKLNDLLYVQEEIARAVAEALSVSLEVGKDSRAYGGTNNPEAFAAFVQGRGEQLNVDQSIPRAFLERAIALDPHYARVLASLASSYGFQLTQSQTKEEASRLLAKMDSYSARAVAASPDNSYAYALRGNYELSRRDFQAAGPLIERAVALDKGNDVEARVAIAFYEFNLGRTDEAMKYNDSIELMDPLFSKGGNPFYLLLGGRFQRAVDAFDWNVSNNRPGAGNQAIQAYWAHMMLGEEDEAADLARKYQLQSAFLLEDNLQEMSLPELRQWAVESFGDTQQAPLILRALVASHRGQAQLAVNLLRLGYERPGSYMLWGLWHPAMANARKTPEFAQLVTDLGFTKVWQESGNWGDYCEPKDSGGITCH